jgi:UDP-glucose 4-epimerase
VTDKLLIVGISGGYGRLLARRMLRTHAVVGVDRSPGPTRLPDVPFYAVDTRTRAFEEVLRKERPDAVAHLGFLRDFSSDERTRYDVNVRGTRKLLDLCLDHGVHKVTVLSTGYVYGALPENPQFMDEEHPLSGSRGYPEIRDLVELDALATSFMWRHPDIHTSVLRPVPALGTFVESAIGRYLRMNPVVLPMGFNPMLQVIHEEDLTEALALSIELGLNGVYNVTGPGEVPAQVVIRETGGRVLPVPDPLLRSVSKRLFGLPPGAIDFMKYSCTIDGARFVAETGFEPIFGLKDIFRVLRSQR